MAEFHTNLKSCLVVVNPVGKESDDASKPGPQVIVGVPLAAVIASHNVCPSVGVPERFVVIEVIFPDCAVME